MPAVSRRSCFVAAGGIVAVATWALIPAGPVTPDVRINVALALALATVALWWARAAVRASRWNRGAALVTLAAASIGALAMAILARSGFGGLPRPIVRFSLLLLMVEGLLWAASLLRWTAGAPPRARRPVVVVDGLSVVIAGALLFWDFQIRPSHGLPATFLPRLAIASWGMVIAAISIAIVRGSPAQNRAPFRLLAVALGTVVASNYAQVTFLAWPAWLGFVTAIVAGLLRLAAAEAVLQGWGSDRSAVPASEPSAPILVGGVALLLTTHQIATPPGGPVLPIGITVLVIALAGRAWLSRRVAGSPR
jgi:hypothetical protein